MKYGIVGISGLALIGWLCGYPLLTSIRPEWVTMKFVTAFCFLLIGLDSFLKKKPSHYFLSGILIGAVIYLITWQLAAQFLGFGIELKNLFVLENGDPVFSVGAGIPSVMTMVGLLVFSFGEIAGMFGFKVGKAVGAILCFIGVMALLGYALAYPPLYFYSPGVSSAMAINTALCFFLLGIIRKCGVDNLFDSPSTGGKIDL